MSSVLISTRPKWCEKICHEIGKNENGKPIYEKRIEVRKSAPKEVPFKAYIYCTNQKINGEILLTNDKKVEGRNRGFRDNGDIPLASKVIGEFICDKVYNIEPIFSFYGCYSGYDDTSDCSYFEGYSIDDERLEETCLTQQDLCIYGNGNRLYGWHISDLKIYDKPKELREFYKPIKYDNVCGANVVHCGHYQGLETVDYCEYNDGDCSLKGCKELRNLYQIKRPPQSWCYVEDYSNEKQYLQENDPRG